jgi:hypothetical protein
MNGPIKGLRGGSVASVAPRLQRLRGGSLGLRGDATEL